MRNYNYFLQKPKYDIVTGKRLHFRKAFKTSTKKKIWMKAGGHDPDKWRTGFIKTSKCMNPRCPTKIRLVWGEGTYEFDHKDNNSANDREKNCYLVCKVCHGKATKRGPNRLIRDNWSRIVIGEKATMKKVGYKKSKVKKRLIRKKRKKHISDPFGFRPLRLV